MSVHWIRHTTAVHLLRSGVDINTIRAWLGHVSFDTTHVYAEVDLQMKQKALQHSEIVGKSQGKLWKGKPKLMEFLGAVVMLSSSRRTVRPERTYGVATT